MSNNAPSGLGWNVPGTPLTSDLLLGRGILMAGKLAVTGTGQIVFWRDLGNANAFSLSPDTQTVDHKTSYDHIRSTDARVTLEQSYTISFTLEEFSMNNLSAWFLGEVGLADIASIPVPTGNLDNAYSNANPIEAGAIANATIFVTSTTGGLVPYGRWMELYDNSGNRAYDLGSVVTVEGLGGSPALTEGTDYILDRKQGLIRILESMTEAKALLVATAGGMRYSADQNTSAPERIGTFNILKGSAQDIALRFASVNPNDGGQLRMLTLPRVSITPTGDLPLIGEDWAGMEFEGTNLRSISTATQIASRPYGWVEMWDGATSGILA